MNRSLKKVNAYFGIGDYSHLIVNELELAGITTLKQLDALITEDLIQSYFDTLEKLDKESNYLGFVRDLLIVKYGNSYLSLPLKRRYNFDEWQVPFLESLGARADTIAAVKKRVSTA